MLPSLRARLSSSSSSSSSRPALRVARQQPLVAAPKSTSSRHSSSSGSSSCRISSGSRMASAAAGVDVQTHSPSGLLYGPTFFLDGFALRQWDDPQHSGTRIQYDKAAFVAALHAAFAAQGGQLADGYAPFCKHVFVKNFVGAKLGVLSISESNRHLLRSGYTRRRPEELAVLTRWFPVADVAPVPDAAHLDVILYSREQLVKEYSDMPAKLPGGGGDAADPEALLPDAPWGVISIKAQDEGYETPMQPITMMRNALGRSEGGSGVPLDRAAYEASCAYWQDHAPIVEGEGGDG